jgi:4-hydroxy-tetrahydrodipicolinate reductase
MGRAGTEIVRAAADDPAVDVVCGVVFDPAKAGQDLGALCGGASIGADTGHGWDSLLTRDDVDIVLYCRATSGSALADDLATLAGAGLDTVSVSGPMHPARAFGTDRARALDARAAASGARIAGCGLNPGFLLDVQPVAWASLVGAPQRIRGRRVAEISDWGAGALERMGIGGAPGDMEPPQGISLLESVALIADGTGMSLDAVDEHVDPYVLPTDRGLHGRTVAQGSVGGFRLTATGMAGGREAIRLRWDGILCIDPDADGAQEPLVFEVEGASTVTVRAGGDFFTDAYGATAARALRAIAPLRRLPGGLHRATDLGVA